MKFYLLPQVVEGTPDEVRAFIGAEAKPNGEVEVKIEAKKGEHVCTYAKCNGRTFKTEQGLAVHQARMH